MTTTDRAPETSVTARLSTLDRYLPVWIGVAMVAGLLLGRLVPGLGDALAAVEIEGVSLPIAVGLLVMMYPVLAKVRYDRLDTVTRDGRMLGQDIRQRPLDAGRALAEPGEGVAHRVREITAPGRQRLHVSSG